MISAILGATLLAAAHRLSEPGPSALEIQGGCSNCHEGSAPRSHTRTFVAREHGPAAQENGPLCLGCHEDVEKSCDDCHRAIAPDWHTDDFRNPALGSVEAGEHVRIAREHRDACSTCHAVTYMDRCVDCHRPEEDWLGRSEGSSHRASESDRSLERVH